jgi:hypothetical protein
MPVVEEGAHAHGDEMNSCTSDGVPDDLPSAGVVPDRPACHEWVKFLSREEFEQILEAEFDWSVGFGTAEDSGPVGIDWVIGSAEYPAVGWLEPL